MTDKDREGFEAWLLDVHGLTDEWEETRNCYKAFFVHLAWKAWQAARAESAKEIEGLRNALRDSLREIWWLAQQAGCDWKDEQWRKEGIVGKVYDAGQQALAATQNTKE
jgi:hypothetical protein